MKNIQPMLFYFETLCQWNFRNIIQLFNLTPSTRYKEMFQEVYYGVSHPQSRYEMYLTKSKTTNYTEFMIEDKKTKKPVLFGDYRNINFVSKMYPDWMQINQTAKKLQVFDSRNKMVLDASTTMTEEEHFQKMMLSELPPFEVFEDAFKVYEYLQPIADRHNIGFSIDYDEINHDFSEFFPSNEAYDIIDSLFGNALELYYEAEEHGNPFNYYTLS